jgi:hypothetical protein
VIVTVPAATPVTTPAALTAPIDVLLLLQVPPVTESVKVIVAPAHTVEAPLIVPADVLPFTATVAVRVTGPQLAVMV